jgi:hypothetical protein
MSNERMLLRLLEVCLVIGVMLLLLQLFPAAWDSSLAMVDVRQWSWRSYAVASAVAIVVLVALKASRDQR